MQEDIEEKSITVVKNDISQMIVSFHQQIINTGSKKGGRVAEIQCPVGRQVEETEQDKWTHLRAIQSRVKEQRFERLQVQRERSLPF